MEKPGTLLLTRTEIASLLSFRDYFDAIEEAFRAHGESKTMPQGLMHLDSDAGEFHIKGGGLRLERIYFAFKINGGFYQNSRSHGLPNILGSIVLCDGETGYPLAIMDSGEITRQRTAAAAAVAARYLARPDSSVATICGCGVQGHAQLRGLASVLPIKTVFAFDMSAEQRTAFANEMSNELGIDVRAVDDVAASLQQSDICITCTPSRRHFVERSYIRPGTFVAAMGADSPDKQEIEPELLRGNKLVVDIVDQCKRVGELHHALDSGVLQLDDVYAELGEIVCGKKPGRTSAAEVTIFDSTGTALQDVAAAVAVHRKATNTGAGRVINLLA